MKRALSITIVAVALMLTIQPLWAQESDELVAHVYQIKWKQPVVIANTLQDLARQTANVRSVSPNQELGTITVVATDQGQAVVSELIKRYDVPSKGIEFQFYLLQASTAGQGITNGVPEVIRRVIDEISVLTRYQSFALVDSPVIRASEGNPAEFGGKAAFFYNIRAEVGPVIAMDDAEKQQIRVDNFSISFLRMIGQTPEGVTEHARLGGIKTSFTIGDGETIVLGASRIQDRGDDPGEAVITVVTARILD